jgi:ribosomal RNA assembly protein
MIFEKLVRIPVDRVGALIGKSGEAKSKIERVCSVRLDIDSDTGETLIIGKGSIDDIQPFKAVEIVTAIGRGFSPQNAMRLLKGENSLYVIDLKEFAGKSPTQIERIKGRIIGEGGKARINMENLSGSSISVYGKTVAIIGTPHQLKLAVNAITSLSRGSMHGTVFNKLETARRREKLEKLKLWEDNNVF